MFVHDRHQTVGAARAGLTRVRVRGRWSAVVGREPMGELREAGRINFSW